MEIKRVIPGGLIQSMIVIVETNAKLAEPNEPITSVSLQQAVIIDAILRFF